MKQICWAACLMAACQAPSPPGSSPVTATDSAALQAASPCFRITSYGSLEMPRLPSGTSFVVQQPNAFQLTKHAVPEFEGRYFVAGVPKWRQGEVPTLAAWAEGGDSLWIDWRRGNTRYILAFKSAGDTLHGRLKRVSGLAGDGYVDGDVSASKIECKSMIVDVEGTRRMLAGPPHSHGV